MFTAVKKGNLTKDVEKSRVRIMEEFKALSSTAKKEVYELSGMSTSAFYNIEKTGAASPKVVLSLAQIANVSPYYLIGMADEKESFKEKAVNKFLKEFNIELEFAKPEKAKRKNRKEKEDEVKWQEIDNLETYLKENKEEIAKTQAEIFGTKEDVKPETVAAVAEEKSIEPECKCACNIPGCECECDELEATISFGNSEKMQNAVNSLDEESAVTLLKALLKRSQASGQAEMLCDVVKRCLLA